MHPVYADVAADPQRSAVCERIPTVVSLNYDLTLYWAMLLFNARRMGVGSRTHSTTGSSRRIGVSAATLWARCRSNIGFSTLTAVLRLLVTTQMRQSSLVGAGAAGDLLGTITRRWASGHLCPWNNP